MCRIATALRIVGCAAALLTASMLVAAAADTERLLYSFNGTTLGGPYGMIADASGNLYGVTSPTTGQKYGGVFRLNKGPAGHWNLTTIYAFRGASDGESPVGLVFDSAGNLYGTTAYKGGERNCSCGTVFELTPTTSGPWKETTLYSFKGGDDGAMPFAGLARDSAGNLYGTTSTGGQYNTGTVFEISPITGGGWSESILYEFRGGSDGIFPEDPLTLDQDGNIYGVTRIGGGLGSCLEAYGCGTVFELTLSSGVWTESVPYTFTGVGDGGVPIGGLVLDQHGDLYGEANRGGDLSVCGGTGCGVVFELHQSSGSWTEDTLHSFQDVGDGAYPEGGLTINKIGILYGVTIDGGSASCGCGTVFEVYNRNEGWAENTLYQFAGGSDGAQPDFAPVLDKLGDLYGTTANGGTGNAGTAFKLIP